ncbi:MAG: phage replisome organizer N-terminal domain-containing protein [Chloroflexi bacterium]|nr:phage replisome organizer N-terminal domain-containing protein [Chloroflexota bacterium]
MSSEHPWFSVYDEILSDNKLARVRRATRQHRLMVIGAWTTLLALSNQSPVRGVLLIREDRPLTVQEIFEEWDVDTLEGQTLLDAFIDQGMLHHEGEAWVICNWEKRQPKQDKSTERVRQWRQKIAAAANAVKPEKPETDETFQGVTYETGATFRGGHGETFRNDTEKEIEIEIKYKEREGESEGEGLYSFERRLGRIVANGVSPGVGTRRQLPYSDDDEVANAIWEALLTLCDNDEMQARCVAIVTNELSERLEWLKPFPRRKQEFQDALSHWWRPIKKALKVRDWDTERTVIAMVEAAKSLHQRQYAPSRPAGLMGEMSKQAAGRGSPALQPGSAQGKALGVDAIREKIKQRGGGGGNG